VGLRVSLWRRLLPLVEGVGLVRGALATVGTEAPDRRTSVVGVS